MRDHAVLLDELHSPSVRETIGRLLATAERADLAIARVRLAALDLDPTEIAGLERCRLLLSRLDADLLHDGAVLDIHPEKRVVLQRLFDWTQSGRLEVRSAGAVAWVPDFSVYHDVAGAGDVLLLGPHYFQSMFSGHGAALTCCLQHVSVVRRAAERFEELWDRSYDVLPIIAEGLAQTLDASIPNGHTAAGGVCDSARVVR
jgi:hypothetical protein